MSTPQLHLLPLPCLCFEDLLDCLEDKGHILNFLCFPQFLTQCLAHYTWGLADKFIVSYIII